VIAGVPRRDGTVAWRLFGWRRRFAVTDDGEGVDSLSRGERRNGDPQHGVHGDRKGRRYA